MYELTDRVMQFETGISKQNLEGLKAGFEKSGKAYFYKGWIFVPKASFYGGYEGIKNKMAYDKEKRAIPSYILNGFKEKRDTV